MLRRQIKIYLAKRLVRHNCHYHKKEEILITKPLFFAVLSPEVSSTYFSSCKCESITVVLPTPEPPTFAECPLGV